MFAFLKLIMNQKIDSTHHCSFQNVIRLNTKISDLFIDSFDFDFQIVAFTETWLTVNTCDSEII